MSINIIAMLLSLAMMLTGAGGEGQPAEAARTLYLHDISISYNGETVNLAPGLKLGAATDGKKAVFDLGVLLGDEKLFPIQLGASEDGVTLLHESSNFAATIPAKTLEDALSQVNDLLATVTDAAASTLENVETENKSELLDFMMKEFVPAYVGILEAAQDEDFKAAVELKGDELFGEIVDRGEGKPLTETIDGKDYALLAYSYTIDSKTLAELVDAVMTSNETFEAYYNAMFKLYDMAPEESGLNDIHSYQDLFEKFGLDLTLAIDEKLSDDGAIDIVDAVLTMDMNTMIQKMSDAQDGGNEDELPEVAPIVMNIHSTEIGEVKDANVDFAYQIDEAALTMTMSGHKADQNDVDLDLDIRLTQEGEEMGYILVNLTAARDEATDEADFSLNYGIGVADQMSMDVAANGKRAADGSSKNSFAFDVGSDGASFSFGFDLDVLTDAIEDKANGHEAALVIDDLSEEALQALTSDEQFQSSVMPAAVSASMDVQKLMGDESVQQLMNMFTPAEPETIDYEDDSFEGEELDEYAYDYDDEYAGPEDDGELGFNQPEFTWLPDGWKVENTSVDTAYDWVSVDLVGEGSDNAYASFYANVVENTVNYVVTGNGSIEAVDDRLFEIVDYGDGMISAGFEVDGVCCDIMFHADKLDVETIGKIVAGVKF